MGHQRAGSTVLATMFIMVAACGPGGSMPSPSPEPREAVVGALRSTAGLKSVHAIIEVGVERGGATEFSATMEGDVAVAARELDVTVRFSPVLFGATASRLIIANGFTATQTDGGPWSVSGSQGGDPLNGVPTTAMVAAAIERAIRDTTTTVTAQAPEACGDETCYRVRAEIPREVAWRVWMDIVGPTDVHGGTAMPAPPVPDGFPAFTIDLWIDQDTLRLRRATNTTVVNDESFAVTVVLSRHDAPVSIALPLDLPPAATPAPPAPIP